MIFWIEGDIHRYFRNLIYNVNNGSKLIFYVYFLQVFQFQKMSPFGPFFNIFQLFQKLPIPIRKDVPIWHLFVPFSIISTIAHSNSKRCPYLAPFLYFFNYSINSNPKPNSKRCPYLASFCTFFNYSNNSQFQFEKMSLFGPLFTFFNYSNNSQFQFQKMSLFGPFFVTFSIIPSIPIPNPIRKDVSIWPPFLHFSIIPTIPHSNSKRCPYLASFCTFLLFFKIFIY